MIIMSMDYSLPSHSANHGYGSIQESDEILQSAPAASQIAYENSTVSASTQQMPSAVHTYKRRWYMLFLFSTIGLWQGIVWNTWGPISDSAKLVFGWRDAEIAMFANVGNAMYCVVVFFASYIMDVIGLRVATLICSGFIFVGAAVRCITSASDAQYWLCFLGAVLNGSAGTVTFSAPALFSSIWFPRNQRATATAIMSMFNYIGVSASFIIGPQIVKFINPFAKINVSTAYNHYFTAESLNDQISNISNATPIPIVPSNKDAIIANQRHEIMELLYIEAGVAALLFLLVIIYFPSKPPKPPSISAAVERLDFKEGLKILSKQGKFWLVGLSYSIPSGVLGMWCSVLNINLHHVSPSFTQDTAGWLGFYYITAGAVAGLFVCMFSDHFARHIKGLLLGLYICAGAALLWVLLLCESYIPYTKEQLFGSVILAGVFINAAIPLFYEMASELCYPVAEGIIGGYLTFLNNLVGVFLLSSFYIPNLGASWLNWTMLISTVATIPLLALVPASYERLQLDSSYAENIPAINDVEHSVVNGNVSEHAPLLHGGNRPGHQHV